MNGRRIGTGLAAGLTALVLSACFGGDDDATPRYSRLVVFGDSLSDVGTYRVGTIAAAGGGEFTVNAAAGSPGANWTEVLARQLGFAAPCAAQTGLQSTIPVIPPVPVVEHPECWNYAQGGSRVTNPIGPYNAALPGPQFGALTKPVVEQIARHLGKVGGAFAADDLVVVLAGGNDVIVHLGQVSAGVETPTAAVTALGTAGAELGGYVKTQLVGKGAKTVLLVNLPDVGITPSVAGNASAQALATQMSSTFNAQLAAAVAGTAGVVTIDAYARSRDQAARPAQYGLTNVTTPACDLTRTILPTSLVCTAATLVAGDTSRWLFADGVHQTPYGNELLAKLVTDAMAQQGL